MTDSMKFGPEWIRNLSSETFPNTSNVVPKVQLAEKRYSRDEMLFLYDKNRLVAPDSLKLHPSLYSEEIQVPFGIECAAAEKVPGRPEIAGLSSGWQTRNHPQRARTLAGRNSSTGGFGSAVPLPPAGIPPNRSAIRNSQNFQNPHNTHLISSNWNGGSVSGGGTGATSTKDWASSVSGPVSISNGASSSWRHKSSTWRNESEAKSGGGYSSSAAYDAADTGGSSGGDGSSDVPQTGGKNSGHVQSIGGSAKWNKWRASDSASSFSKTEALPKKVSWTSEGSDSADKSLLASTCNPDHRLFAAGSLRSEWNTDDIKTANGPLDDEQSFGQQIQNPEALDSFSSVRAPAPLQGAGRSVPISSSSSMTSSSSLHSTSTSVSSGSSVSSVSSVSSKKVTSSSSASATSAHKEQLSTVLSNSNETGSESLSSLPNDMHANVNPEVSQPFDAQKFRNLFNYLDTASYSQNISSIMNHASNLNQMAQLSSVQNGLLMQQHQQQHQQQYQQQLHNQSLLAPLPPPPTADTKMPPPPPNLNALQSQAQSRYQLQTGLPMSLASKMMPPPPPSLPLPNAAASVSGAFGSSSLSFASILEDKWYYLDPQGKVQGPFTTVEMNDWYRVGYFSLSLNVRRQNDTLFVPLQELVKMNPHFPFHVPQLQSAQPQAQPQSQSQQKLFLTSASMDSNSGATTAAATTPSLSTPAEAGIANISPKLIPDSGMPPTSGFPSFSSDFLLDNQLKQLLIEQKQRSELIMLLQHQAMMNSVVPGLTPTTATATATATHPLLSSVLSPPLQPLQPLQPLLFHPPPPAPSSLLNPSNLDPQSQQKHISSIESTNFLLSLMKQPQQTPSNQAIVPPPTNDFSSLNFFNAAKQLSPPPENLKDYTKDSSADSNYTIKDQKEEKQQKENEVSVAAERNNHLAKDKSHKKEIAPLQPNSAKKGANVEKKTEAETPKAKVVGEKKSKDKLKSSDSAAVEANRGTKEKVAKSTSSSSTSKISNKSYEKSEPNTQAKSVKKVKEKSIALAPPHLQAQQSPVALAVAEPTPAPVPKAKSKPTAAECKAANAKTALPSLLTTKRQTNEHDKKSEVKAVAQAANNNQNGKRSPHETSKQSTKESRIWSEVDQPVLPLREIQKIEQTLEKKKIESAKESAKKSALSLRSDNQSNEKSEMIAAGWAKAKANATTTTAKSKLPTLKEIQAEQKKVQSEIAKVKSSMAAALASQQVAAAALLQEKKTAWANNATTSLATKMSTATATASTKVATAWSGGFWDCESTKAVEVAAVPASKPAAVGATSKQNAKSEAAASSADMKNDRLDLERWCAKVLMHAAGNDCKGVDIAELVKLLIDAESASDIRDYVCNYFGQSKGIEHFLSQFSERKSKFIEKHFRSQPKSIIKNAAPSSINKQHVASAASVNKNKKSKKKEMKKIEPSLLGIRAVAAENRYNAGDLDFGDDS